MAASVNSFLACKSWSTSWRCSAYLRPQRPPARASVQRQATRSVRVAQSQDGSQGWHAGPCLPSAVEPTTCWHATDRALHYMRAQATPAAAREARQARKRTRRRTTAKRKSLVSPLLDADPPTTTSRAVRLACEDM